MFLGKRSAKELGKNTAMDGTTFCKSAYVSNNGTEVVGTLENGNCRFDLKVSYRGLPRVKAKSTKFNVFGITSGNIEVQT